MANKPFFLTVLIFLIFLVSCSSGSTINNKLSDSVPIIIQFSNSCDFESLIPGENRMEIKTQDFTLVGSDINPMDIKSLNSNKCVIRTFRPSELKDVIQDLETDFEDDRKKRFQDNDLKRGLENKDVTGKDELKRHLEDKHPEEELPGEAISPYQLYVTPDSEAVQELAEKLDGVQEIYDEALSWIWVSETYLNGVEEMWYYPEEFLTETPGLSTNPSSGDIASDCSEQANTLTSLLIADGFGEENVRVVLGLVDFSGQIGGHAWVEIYEDGGWFALEATAGRYYDESTGTISESEDIPYNYFEYASFPVEEVWYYYNNEYFWDETQSSGNAPDSWKEQARSKLKERLQNFQGVNNQNGNNQLRGQGKKTSSQGNFQQRSR